MNPKTDTIDITNGLSTSGSLNISKGYIFRGNTYSNSSDNDSQNLPPKSYMGTSQTRGNTLRNRYNTNTNGPIQYNETQDDKKQAVQSNLVLVKNNPYLATFPYLNPRPLQEEWTPKTTTALEFSKNPDLSIYKYLGRGIGEVTFLTTGQQTQGYETLAGTTLTVNPQNEISYGTYNSEFIQDGILYPYSGKIYAGTLVQLSIQTDLQTGIKKTVVIPYQSGRGIPQPCKNYYPNQELFQYAPWGPIRWPDSDNIISPNLSPGVESGQNCSCVGIVLDQYSAQLPRNKIFPQNTYQQQDPHELGTLRVNGAFSELSPNKPAPFTCPPKSVKVELPNSQTQGYTQGFLSPGPNLSDTFWSPWPSGFAYQEGEPIPVLTKGITTARIGAAYNVALTQFGIQTQISATDSVWIPIPCIPLFQGERLEAGSYIYASVKGNIVTPGPYIPQLYLTDTDGDPNSLVSGIIGQTPWDVFTDSTWGNVGWTGTPGMCFSMIPDQGISIMESVDSTLDYLCQSLQGTVIVHPVTSVSPEPALGNNYLNILTGNSSIDNLTPEEKYTVNVERFNLPGVSGRCMLPQSVPEKAQPIGIVLETIIGTGKWPYTGLPTEYVGENIVFLTFGGADYINPTTVADTTTRGGSGTGLTLTWTEYEESYPYLGTIFGGVSIVSPGIGYVDGDVITVQDTNIQYETPQYKSNNASFIYQSGDVSLYTGSGYQTPTSRDTFNLSKNCLYLYFDADGLGTCVRDGTTPVIPDTDYPQDYSKFPFGTVFRVMQTDVPQQEQAVSYIDEVSSSISNTVSLYDGTGYPNSGGDSVYELNIINYNYSPPLVRITPNTDPPYNIKEIHIIDFGAGNLQGDIILCTEPTSDQNGTFVFPQIPPGYQEITHGASQYSNQLYNTYLSGTNTGNGLEVNIYTDTLRYTTNPNELLAIGFNVSAVGTASVGEIYQVYYTGGYNINPNPWYHGRRFSLLYKSLTEFETLRGGSGYISEVGVSCYNLTANSLRLRYDILGGIIVSKTAGDPLVGNDNFDFVSSRYTFDPIDGTEIRILNTDTPPDIQQIDRLVSNIGGNNITTSTIRQGSYYNLADGTWFFQTQRTDQTNPTVTIVSNYDPTYREGQVLRVILEDVGTNNQNGDIILITQTNSDLNAFFIFNDNMAYIDLPPYAYRKGFKVDSSEAAWKKYSDTMQSATNLLDKQILIELRPSASSVMENIYPNAQASYPFMPGTNNPFEVYY